LAREETGYVLDEEEAGSKRLSDSCELKEEAGSVACESRPFSGNGEVLAGEAAGQEIKINGVIALVSLALCSVSVPIVSSSL
jgi:hypothetical protein